jgi:hypothetical protein
MYEREGGIRGIKRQQAVGYIMLKRAKWRWRSSARCRFGLLCFRIHAVEGNGIRGHTRIHHLWRERTWKGRPLGYMPPALVHEVVIVICISHYRFYYKTRLTSNHDFRYRTFHAQSVNRMMVCAIAQYLTREFCGFERLRYMTKNGTSSGEES